jgi:cytosine/adenosine deaminase-related metal-dependent hydrolase
MHPTTDPVSNLVYAAGSKGVWTVIVDGRVIVDAGRPMIDPVDVYRGADDAAQAVLGRMGYRTPRRWPSVA